MKSTFEIFLTKKLVEKKGNQYTIKLEDGSTQGLGIRKDHAEKKLEALIKEGKVALTEQTPPSISEKNEVDEKPSTDTKTEVENSTQKKPTETKKGLGKLPETEEQQDDEMFSNLEEMAKKLGDISKRGEAGKFDVFINGVKTKSKSHPVIKTHPYVYRHCIASKSVKSGATLMNDGWTVLSKKFVSINPRTGKNWLTVAHDDTPDEDFYTVGKTVLCYASKKQFDEKKARLVISNISKVAKTLDSRKESAQRAAMQSEVGGMTGVYSSDVQSTKAEIKEAIMANHQMNESQATAQIQSMESESFDSQIERAKNDLKNFDSVKNIQKVSLDQI